MLTVKRLCTHMIRLLHAPVRIYDASGRQTAIYIDHGEQQDILDCDRELLCLLMEKREPDTPVLYLEAQEIVYGVIYDGNLTYILGPCCIGSDSVRAADYLIREHGMDTEKPYRVPVISMEHFGELLLLLFETVTGRGMSINELYMQCFCNSKFESALREKSQQVFVSLRESAAVHNPHTLELREHMSIRNGDLDALKKCLQETYVGQMGILSRDPLRHAKNVAIVTVTLACRAAIFGGLLPEVAFTMSDAFIQRAEELKNVGEVNALARQIEIEYCQAVKNLNSSGGQNSLITRCKERVVQQLHSKLTVQELAKQLEVSPDYLSHLFVKEEGIKLIDYITQEKISSAQKRLVYTQDAYDVVAFSLGFSSQSHFGKAFKKWTGMTPKQYREQYGKQTKRNTKQ